MPCIFCLAVFALFAGAVTTVVLDQMEARLASVATGPVSRTVDSESAAVFETSVRVPGRGDRSVPVTVTVYKKHKRIRIQVMTHDLTRAEAESVEDLVAQALELRIVSRSDAHDEQQVREAFGEQERDDALESEATIPEPNRPAPVGTDEPESAEPRARPRDRA
jgi:hypothetical protein